MALIEVPRLTAADVSAWQRYEMYDAVLAQDPSLDRMADKAAQVMAAFVAEGPAMLGCSWGRDSLVILHIAVTHGVDVPVWRMVGDLPPYRADNPDTNLVRDAFLAQYPDFDYNEFVPTTRDALKELNRQEGLGRYISGIRADESARRKKVMSHLGAATKNTARPIGWWRSEHVWAYLHKHDLPVHPAYACSFGGALNRDRLRVHSLGGAAGTSSGRARWEREYYPEVFRELTHAEAE